MTSFEEFLNSATLDQLETPEIALALYLKTVDIITQYLKKFHELLHKETDKDNVYKFRLERCLNLTLGLAEIHQEVESQQMIRREIAHLKYNSTESTLARQRGEIDSF
jgi:hypothetical protein